MERPTICNTCFEEDNVRVPVKGFIDGEPFCEKHLAALGGVVERFGLTVTDTEDESEIIRKSAAERLPLQSLPPVQGAQGVLDALSVVMQGVLSGDYSAKQANAVAGLSTQMLKAVELEWKMNRSKDISFIVKQLDAKP